MRDGSNEFFFLSVPPLMSSSLFCCIIIVRLYTISYCKQRRQHWKIYAGRKRRRKSQVVSIATGSLSGVAVEVGVLIIGESEMVLGDTILA